MKRIRVLGALQWLGFFVAALAWIAQHALGQGVAEVQCSTGGSHWGISNEAWQIGLMVGAGVLILGAEAAAVAVFRATSESSYESAPPIGRIRFVAIASMTANLIFLVIVLLDGIASIANIACRGS